MALTRAKGKVIDVAVANVAALPTTGYEGQSLYVQSVKCHYTYTSGAWVKDTAWVDYSSSATATPGGSMTLGSESFAWYDYQYKDGGLLSIELKYTATVGGTPDTYVGILLPESLQTTNTGHKIPATILDNGAYTTGYIELQNTNIYFRRADAAAFTAGSIELYGSCTFQAT